MTNRLNILFFITGVAKRTCQMDGMWSNVDIDLCISEIVLNIATMVKN